jgi:hypothetical protein
MLRDLSAMENYAIGATDGVIGRVKDFYFDDEAWVVRYLVVETGAWLSHRKVLISPLSLGVTGSERVFPARLTQQQVRNSPNIDTDKPVLRQHELDFIGYYGYPAYWGGASLWGSELSPQLLGRDGGVHTVPLPSQQDDPRLRSVNAVMSYRVLASDGSIGTLAGLLIDESTWAIRFLVVNTGHWWHGYEVLIAPEWIEDINWAEATVTVDLSRDSVRAAPNYDERGMPWRASRIEENRARTR